MRRGITRLIDAYQEGFLEREEFEPRIRAAKERLAKLETEAKAAADRESEAQDLQNGDRPIAVVRLPESETDWKTRTGALGGRSCER